MATQFGSREEIACRYGADQFTGSFGTTLVRPPQTVDTKAFFIPTRVSLRQYLTLAAILSVGLCVSISARAHGCAAVSEQTGVASWYGPGLQGNRTTSGERFDMWGMTAAHPCLPMGTRLRVTVPGTGRTLIVTVNDRLPSRRRILDLSKGAARALGIASRGVAVVQVSTRSTSTRSLALQ